MRRRAEDVVEARVGAEPVDTGGAEQPVGQGGWCLEALPAATGEVAARTGARGPRVARLSRWCPDLGPPSTADLKRGRTHRRLSVKRVAREIWGCCTNGGERLGGAFHLASRSPNSKRPQQYDSPQINFSRKLASNESVSKKNLSQIGP
jgi:ribosomal protein L37AE/L43A